MSDNSTVRAVAPQQTVTSKRDEAIRLAASGRRIFPLVPNGKTPSIASTWGKTASKDIDRVCEMWTCPVTDAELDDNIGIALDPDDLVLDTDQSATKDGEKELERLEGILGRLPRTTTVRTRSGGKHRHFKIRIALRNTVSSLALGIDTKTFGGYVVGPGSCIDGKLYEIIDASPFAFLPPAWVDYLQSLGRTNKAAKVEVGTLLVKDFDTEAAISRSIEYLTSKAPDSGTYAVAAKVKDFGISEEKAGELMLEHWRDARNLDKDDEHVLFRISNAYRYGQNAVGISAPEAEFEAVEISAKERPRGRSLYPIRWTDAAPDLEQQYLIDDVMDLGVMVVTYGDSNVGKTYVKLDQCFHIAAGKDWNGHKVKQGLVIYVAAEGGRGFLKRIQAFKNHYGAKDLPFSLVPCPIDLQTDGADTNKLVKLIREEEDHFGQKCVLIVIDTLARAMAGGDENTAVDMSKFVGHSDRLRAATGATVDVIHHTGKDKAKGARGSSALRAATDTEIEIGEGVFETKKQRDMAKGRAINFELVAIDVGERSDGKKVSACVVNWTTSAADDFNSPLTPPQQLALDALDQLLFEAAKSGATKRTVTPGEWCKAIETAKGGGKGGKQLLARVGPVLIQAGYVVKTANNHYVRIAHE